jgi:hypothetical protein
MCHVPVEVLHVKGRHLRGADDHQALGVLFLRFLRELKDPVSTVSLSMIIALLLATAWSLSMYTGIPPFPAQTPSSPFPSSGSCPGVRRP